MANSGLLIVPVAGSVFLLRCLGGFLSEKNVFPKAIDALVEFFGNSSYPLLPFSQYFWGLGQEAGLVHTHRGWYWYFPASPILISPFLARAEGSVSHFKSNGLSRNPQGSPH